MTDQISYCKNKQLENAWNDLKIILIKESKIDKVILWLNDKLKKVKFLNE